LNEEWDLAFSFKKKLRRSPSC